MEEAEKIKIRKRIKQLDHELDLLRTEYVKNTCGMGQTEGSFSGFEAVGSEQVKELNGLSRKLRLHKELTFESLDSNGDHMLMGDFIEDAISGGFIDYDGFGFYATEAQQTNGLIYPSDVVMGEFKREFTHIKWYNR